MNTIAEIIDLCEERIQDSKMLHSQGRYDWAFYSAGYAVELVLKARIAKILDFEKINRLADMLNDNIYYVERNANPKILFLDTSIRVHALLKKA